MPPLPKQPPWQPDTSELFGVPWRRPYASEMAFFRRRPDVAGMAAEDNRVILNPMSVLSRQQKNAVAKNEALRVLMRETPPPEFGLTEAQQARFNTYGSPSDTRATIIARILSEDPSMGDVTEEQRRIADTMKRLFTARQRD